MTCSRCGGCLVVEWFCDYTEISFDQRTPYERCLNCGVIEDVLIRTNRLQRRRNFTSRRPASYRRSQLLIWDPVEVP